MTTQPEEFEPETTVDPTDGIYESDAVEVLEAEEPDEREEFLDAERREELPEDDDDDNLGAGAGA
jgi:hypothetical protein